MSKRIEDALEVLSLMRDLYSHNKQKSIYSLRNEAIIRVASRGVARSTVFAHVVGKNVEHKLSAHDFDQLAIKWLERDSNEIEQWYLSDANTFESERIRRFFHEYGVTPLASDISEPQQPQRSLTSTYRILRDTALARRIKAERAYKCELCGNTLKLGKNRPYAEAHHVVPLGREHNGHDIPENIICVCPNCHVLLDYGAVLLESSQVTTINDEYIAYHNKIIAKDAPV